MSLEKRFELGISFVDLSILEPVKKYLSGITVGAPFVENHRGSFFPLDAIVNISEENPDLPIWVVANMKRVDMANILPISSMLISMYKVCKITGYVVQDPTLAHMLTDNGIPVKISILNDIQTIQEVEYYVSKGINHIHLSNKLNRDLDTVRSICEKYPTTKFYLLANELCEYHCPYGINHYRLEKAETTIHKYHCDIYDLNKVGSVEWNKRVLQTPFIPPENLSDYPSNVVFKLGTRQFPTTLFGPEQVLQMMNVYTSKQPYSDILDLFPINIPELKKATIEIDKSLFSDWKTCKNNCATCNLCQEALQRR